MKNILEWFYKEFHRLMKVENVFLSEIDIIWYYKLSNRFIDYEIYLCQSNIQDNMIEEYWNKFLWFQVWYYE